MRDAAAIPISETISCVERPVTGVVRSYGYRARMWTSARRASWRSTIRRRHVLGEVLDEERVVGDHALDRLLEQLREARHVDALLRRIEVDGAVDRGRDQLLVGAPADAHRLLHAGHSGP